MAGISSCKINTNVFQGFLLNQSASRLAKTLPGIEHVTGQSECAASKAQFSTLPTRRPRPPQSCAEERSFCLSAGNRGQERTGTFRAFSGIEATKVEHAKEHATELGSPSIKRGTRGFGRYSQIASASWMSRIKSTGKLAVFAI